VENKKIVHFVTWVLLICHNQTDPHGEVYKNENVVERREQVPGHRNTLGKWKLEQKVFIGCELLPSRSTLGKPREEHFPKRKVMALLILHFDRKQES
jgi:hypothetical protein